MMQVSRKTIVVGFFIFVSYLLVYYLDYNNTQNIHEKYKEVVMKICEEYDVNDVGVDIQRERKVVYDYYHVTVRGTCQNIVYSEIHQFVRKIEEIQIDGIRAKARGHVILNGYGYSTRGLNYRDLVCKDEVVYTQLNEFEKTYLENLKTELPHEGMAEKNIGKTKLGEPDEIEYSRNYSGMQERARHITYIWYDTEGTAIVKAKTSRWSWKEDRKVEGYVSNVWIADKLKE